MSESFWKPDDKEWMAQRKIEWRHVQKSLDLWRPRMIQKKHYPLHKELFFYGQLESQSENFGIRHGGGEPFCESRFFFEMWYHPRATLETYQGLFDKQNNTNVLLIARDLLFKFQRVEFPQDYGMLGGREELFVKTLLPEYSSKKERTFEGFFSNKPYPLCFSPFILIQYCIAGTNPILLGHKRNPFNPGQYLWDHMAANLKDLPEKEMVLEDKNSFINFIKQMLYRIKNYASLEEFPHDYPVAVKIANHLKTRFENGEFTGLLMEFYEKTEVV